jgi:hypothetical protein
VKNWWQHDNAGSHNNKDGLQVRLIKNGFCFVKSEREILTNKKKREREIEKIRDMLQLSHRQMNRWTRYAESQCLSSNKGRQYWSSSS